MTLTLELPDELESDLSKEAARLGLSLPEHILNLLSRQKTGNDSPRTGAELVAYWEREGLVGMRNDILDSQEHARRLRQAAETRSRG
jgi:hypothetical protein